MSASIHAPFSIQSPLAAHLVEVFLDLRVRSPRVASIMVSEELRLAWWISTARRFSPLCNRAGSISTVSRFDSSPLETMLAARVLASISPSGMLARRTSVPLR